MITTVDTTQHTISKAELERQADAIEMVLSTHGAPATCTGGHITHRAIIFTMAGTVADRVKPLTTAIAQALSVKPETITISTGGGAVRIDIPRSSPKPVSLVTMFKRLPVEKIPPITALLGLADDGAPLLIRLPSEIAGGHLLITGDPRSGKTSLIITMILSLAKYNQPRALQCVLIGRALSVLDRLPHVLSITLPDLVARLGTRDEHTQPAIIVAIDDIDNLGTADRLAANELIRRGAPAGVYVIDATRSTDRHWPTTITATQGQPAGDFWIEPAHGAAARFIAAYADTIEIADLIGQR